jgi:PhnB protein
MHGSVNLGPVVLMGSDSAPPHYEVTAGFSISVHLGDVPEAERIYHELSTGGRIVMPLQQTFWAARFCVFTDRFGIPWTINCGEPES